MIPIIGQPIISDWGFSCVVTCPSPCGATMIWFGKPGQGASVACGKCRTAYTVSAWPVQDPITMNIDIQLRFGKVG